MVSGQLYPPNIKKYPVQKNIISSLSYGSDETISCKKDGKEVKYLSLSIEKAKQIAQTNAPSTEQNTSNFGIVKSFLGQTIGVDSKGNNLFEIVITLEIDGVKSVTTKLQQPGTTVEGTVKNYLGQKHLDIATREIKSVKFLDNGHIELLFPEKSPWGKEAVIDLAETKKYFNQLLQSNAPIPIKFSEKNKYSGNTSIYTVRGFGKNIELIAIVNVLFGQKRTIYYLKNQDKNYDYYLNKFNRNQPTDIVEIKAQYYQKGKDLKNLQNSSPNYILDLIDPATFKNPASLKMLIENNFNEMVNRLLELSTQYGFPFPNHITSETFINNLNLRGIVSMSFSKNSDKTLINELIQKILNGQTGTRIPTNSIKVTSKNLIAPKNITRPNNQQMGLKAGTPEFIGDIIHLKGIKAAQGYFLTIDKHIDEIKAGIVNFAKIYNISLPSDLDNTRLFTEKGLLELYFSTFLNSNNDVQIGNQVQIFKYNKLKENYDLQENTPDYIVDLLDKNKTQITIRFNLPELNKRLQEISNAHILSLVFPIIEHDLNTNQDFRNLAIYSYSLKNPRFEFEFALDRLRNLQKSEKIIFQSAADYSGNSISSQPPQQIKQPTNFQQQINQIPGKLTPPNLPPGPDFAQINTGVSSDGIFNGKIISSGFTGDYKIINSDGKYIGLGSQFKNPEPVELAIKNEYLDAKIGSNNINPVILCLTIGNYSIVSSLTNFNDNFKRTCPGENITYGKNTTLDQLLPEAREFKVDGSGQRLNINWNEILDQNIIDSEVNKFKRGFPLVLDPNKNFSAPMVNVIAEKIAKKYNLPISFAYNVGALAEESKYLVILPESQESFNYFTNNLQTKPVEQNVQIKDEVNIGMVGLLKSILNYSNPDISKIEEAINEHFCNDKSNNDALNKEEMFIKKVFDKWGISDFKKEEMFRPNLDNTNSFMLLPLVLMTGFDTGIESESNFVKYKDRLLQISGRDTLNNFLLELNTKYENLPLGFVDRINKIWN